MLLQRFLQFNRNLILEAKNEGMLDISIPSVQKSFKSDSAIEKFLEMNFRIEEKTDGVKVNLLRTDTPFNPKDYTKNWIVSYKNNILYPYEFDSAKDDTIKKESHGISQYKFIHKILSKVQSKLKNIPENHEFFLEYLMRKPTLTRSYSEEGLHTVILLAHSPCSYKISNGTVITHPTSFLQNDVLATEFSNITKIHLPPLIFNGPLTINKNGIRVFNAEGILSEKLRTRYDVLKEDKLLDEGIRTGGQDALAVLAELFTSYDSEFGGTQIEGSVLYNEASGKYYKFTLAEQYSKELRSSIKQSYSGTEEEQKEYYTQLEDKADTIFDNLDKSVPYEDQLYTVSNLVYKENLDAIYNPKKTNHNKQDDLYLKLKLMIMDSLDPHSAFTVKQEIKNKTELGFFVGKMRILSIAHVNIIKDALKKNPKGLIIGLVDTSKLGLSFNDRKNIINKLFGNKVKIVKTDNANFARILEPFKNVVSTVFCGQDNETSYSKQLEQFNNKNNTNIILDVADRNDKEDEISATKIESFIRADNKEEFKVLVPKEEWSYWDKLREIFS